jgi:hypothetical protein
MEWRKFAELDDSASFVPVVCVHRPNFAFKSENTKQLKALTYISQQSHLFLQQT